MMINRKFLIDDTNFKQCIAKIHVNFAVINRRRNDFIFVLDIGRKVMEEMAHKPAGLILQLC